MLCVSKYIKHNISVHQKHTLWTWQDFWNEKVWNKAVTERCKVQLVQPEQKTIQHTWNAIFEESILSPSQDLTCSPLSNFPGQKTSTITSHVPITPSFFLTHAGLWKTIPRTRKLYLPLQIGFPWRLALFRMGKWSFHAEERAQTPKDRKIKPSLNRARRQHSIIGIARNLISRYICYIAWRHWTDTPLLFLQSNSIFQAVLQKSCDSSEQIWFSWHSPRVLPVGLHVSFQKLGKTQISGRPSSLNLFLNLCTVLSSSILFDHSVTVWSITFLWQLQLSQPYKTYHKSSWNPGREKKGRKKREVFYARETSCIRWAVQRLSLARASFRAGSR